jgi:preprotein translocase subunit SecD
MEVVVGRVAAALLAVVGLLSFLVSPVGAARRPGPRHEVRLVAVLADVPALTAESTDTTTIKAATAAVASCNIAQVSALLSSGAMIPTTPAPPLNPKQCSVLLQRNSSTRLLVAPTVGLRSPRVPPGLTEKDLETASTGFEAGQGYVVEFPLTKAGLKALNVMAAAGYSQAPSAPRNEVAMVVDGLVYSAPAFQSPSFDGPLQITGDFTANEAADLAAIVNVARRGG